MIFIHKHGTYIVFKNSTYRYIFLCYKILHLFGYNHSLPDIVLQWNSAELYQFSWVLQKNLLNQ